MARVAGLAPSGVEKLRQTLSPDELRRAARFLAPEAQTRFIVARAILRDVLARYAGRAQPKLSSAIVQGQALPGFRLRGRRPGVQSHSRGMALYGVAVGRQVGVDVEQVRSNLDHERIAKRFFSAAEAAALRDLPPDIGAESFFRCWTRKEAYIKARGEGLAIPLASFIVSCAPGEPPALLSVQDHASEVDRWTFPPLPPIAGGRRRLLPWKEKVCGCAYGTGG